MSSRSNAEIKEIRELYKKHYGKELEKALISETSGYFGKFLVSLNNVSDADCLAACFRGFTPSLTLFA